MKAISTFYHAEGIPAMQNKLFSSKAEALAAPIATLKLCQDKTGMVYNQSFNPDFVSYDESYQNDQGHSELFRSHLDEICNLCGNHLSEKKGLIVDVGCGKGGYVELLRSKGFNAIGYDNAYQGSSPYIRKSFFSRDSHDKGELLTLRHVLEHIPSPWKFLEDIAAANSYHGLLYIEVPDLDWILNNRAYFDLFHEHVNYFRAQDFNRFKDGLVFSSKSFGGQYLSVIIDLSYVCNSEPQNHFQLDEALQMAFAGLSKFESEAYDKLASVNDIVIWGAASKGVIFAAKAPEKIKKRLKFAIDINPSKHNQFMPISGVKVLNSKTGLERLDPSALVIIMNPNYEREILQSLPHGQPYLTLN